MRLLAIGYAAIVDEARWTRDICRAIGSTILRFDPVLRGEQHNKESKFTPIHEY